MKQGWCGVDYSWKTSSMSMEQSYKLDCSDYDKLLFSLILPRKATFKVEVITDKGILKKEFSPSNRDLKSTEFELNLAGSKEIRNIKMILEASGGSAGWMRWLGLQNSKKLTQWQNYWKKYSKIKWDKYLVPEDDALTFKPSLGVMMKNAQLEKIREYHSAYVKKHGSSPFTEYAATIDRHQAPEKLIGEMVSHGLRFTRYRNYLRWKDEGTLNSRCRTYAVAGAILKDKKILRLAARAALSLAICGKWGTGFEGHVPGSNFDHRSFDESGIVFNLVVALDLAGEMFSAAGKTFILRTIAERGIGQINYVVWRYSYIFNCNQLAAFSTGRMAGYLALEKNWKHVKPYTDLAMKELNFSMNQIFAEDGGFAEGPAYFQYTLGTGLPAYYNFAVTRQLNFKKILPKPLFQSQEYAELFISTNEEQYFMPLNDCNGRHGVWITPIAFLSKMFPQSQYVRLFKRFMTLKKGLLKTKDLFVWMFAADVPDIIPPYKTFAEIKSINTAASTRKIGKEYVKLLVAGDSTLGGHRHEDAGSFVLEFAGQTFAMDSNNVRYVDPWAAILKTCQRHNTLIPTGVKERPAPLMKRITPLKASGDADVFHAEMDLTESWKNYFSQRKRIWDSKTPDELTISDIYELKKGDGVVFIWLTMLPVEQKNDQVIIMGRKGKVIIDIPSDSICKVERLEYWNKGKIQNKISFSKKGKSGKLSVKVKFELLK